ncbi:hypothetical protein JD969_19960 [Planctomycetota bacterium]|nr:hypothetical protein JD969_19960 [Planctomycetota bacterium]
MRKTLIMLSSLALSGLTLIGCDQQAAQTVKAQEKLDAAMAQIDSADNSYDPKSDVSFDEFRNTKLIKAIEDLSEVQKTGADYQVVAASQLKADIYLSNARFEFNNAKNIYAELGPKAASMLRYVVAVDDAESTVENIDSSIDITPIVNTATDEIKIQQQRISQLDLSTAELKTKLDSVLKRKQAFIETSQSHFANARELKNKAFKVSGDISYKLQAEAAAEVRKADQASAEADKLDAVAELLKVALTLNETESTAASTVVTDLNTRQETAKEEARASKLNLAAAKKDRDVLYGEFNREFSSIFTTFETDYAKKLDDAAQSATDAIASLKKATAKAKSNRGAIQFDQLVAYTELANILTEEAATAGSYGEVLSVIANNNNGLNQSISNEELASVKKTYDAIVAKQAKTIKLAEEAIAAAKEVYQQVATDENAQYKATLDKFAARLKDTVLQ